MRRWLLVLVIVLLARVGAQEPTPKESAILLSATVQATPPCITLAWTPYATGVQGYLVTRRLVGETPWGEPRASLPATAARYADAAVQPGVLYEYRVSRVLGSNYAQHNYLRSGIAVPLVEHRGTVVLVTDTQTAGEMPTELAQLQTDLTGDGWRVLRHDVALTADPAAVRRLLQSDYYAASGEVKSVYLFGRVPIRKSGLTAPDGHHLRPFPADAYYADLDGIWTDTQTTVTGQKATPGDGVFDQNVIPSATEVAVGRVYLDNLPSFNKHYDGSLFVPKDETALLRQYLAKAHAYRTAAVQPPRKALMDDKWWKEQHRALLADGWRAVSPLVGPDAIEEKSWSNFLPTGSYLWAMGGGPGSYCSAGGVCNTEELAKDDPKAVFTLLFGSYFGEWDASDNLLRGVLATTSMGLTCEWTVWPFRHLFPMAMGETIGYTNQLTQSDDGTQYPTEYATGRANVGVTLLGDPTLRLHTVPPPTALTAVAGATGVQLAWAVSPDPAVRGYHVYRAPNARGPFTRLNTALLPVTGFHDAAPLRHNVYQVRAVKLETSACGSYFNASQGVFAELALPAPTFQPDLLVKSGGETLFTGEHDYGDAQRVAQVALPGAPLVYDLQLHNDGAAEDAVKLTVPEPSAGWSLHAFDAATGGTDITLLLATGWSGKLAAGASVPFRVEIAPTVPNPAPLTLAVRAESLKKRGAVDTVRLVALPAPVAHIDLSARALPGGVTVGAGLQRTDDTELLQGTLDGGERVTYALTLVNPDAMPAHVTLTRELVGTLDYTAWRLAITDPQDGDKDLLNALYGGWSVLLPAHGTRVVHVTLTGIRGTKDKPNAGKTLRQRFTAAALGLVPQLDTVLVETTLREPPLLYQPDLLTAYAPRRADGTFATLNAHVYNDDQQQRLNIVLASGDSRRIYGTLVNDGEKDDTLRVTLPTGVQGWAITAADAHQDGTDITAALTGTGWMVHLAPGAHADFALTFTPSDAAPRDVEQHFVLTAVSGGDAKHSDRYLFSAMRAVPARVDLQLRTAAETAFTGEKVYDLTQQTRALITPAGTAAVYICKVRNEGDKTYTLRLFASTGNLAGWQVRVFDAAVDGNEEKTALPGGWSILHVAAGESREFRLEVTPTTAAPGAVQEITLYAMPMGPPLAFNDVVRLVTTVAGKP